MDASEMIKAHLGKVVPYATPTGVELVDVIEGAATARLDRVSLTGDGKKGHHGRDVFAVGEAASDAAVAKALAPLILRMQPVTSMAEITYRKSAHGPLTARATLSRKGSDLMAALHQGETAAFDVDIEVRDGSDEPVVDMKVNWYVTPLQN